MSTVAIIPARGGSRRIPRKNLAELGGKPLISWTIEAAKAAESVDRVLVTTDDREIQAVAKEWGADWAVLRPPELAEPHVPSRAVVLHALGKLHHYGSEIVLLHPTSPFRTGHDIDNALALLYDWQGSVVSFTNDEMNGAIYAARRHDIERVAGFMRLPIRPLHLPLPNGLDIDTPEDMERARGYAQQAHALC